MTTQHKQGLQVIAGGIVAILIVFLGGLSLQKRLERRQALGVISTGNLRVTLANDSREQGTATADLEALGTPGTAAVASITAIQGVGRPDPPTTTFTDPATSNDLYAVSDVPKFVLAGYIDHAGTLQPLTEQILQPLSVVPCREYHTEDTDQIIALLKQVCPACTVVRGVSK